MNPLLEQFLQEARENLKFIEENLEDLGSADTELINSIFRAAHTLKGGAGLVGFESIKVITHSCEDLLDMLRANKIEFQEEMIEALYDGFDEVVNLVEAAEESGDTVEGDAETIERIADRLKGIMGKKEEAAQWKLPFNLIEDPTFISNKKLAWLEKYENEIPFVLPEINENNINEKRLYTLFIDPEEDCMVYGNDPLYTFTLMEEALIGIHCCTTKDLAADILKGEDEEGLELKVQFIGFGYGVWEEILEALYNFSDDLYVLPLDIATLLNITVGESQEVEVLKDIKTKALKAIEEVDKEKLKKVVSEGRDLLNQDSNEAKILDRIGKLIDNINNSQLINLKSVVENLGGKDSAAVEKVQETKNESIEALAEEKQETPVEKSPSEKNYGLVNYILEQQIEQMELPANDEITARVAQVINKCSRYLGIKGIENDDKKSVDEWLKQHKGQKPEPVALKTVAVEAPKVEESTPVATPSTEAAKKEEKKPVIGKVVKVEQESIDHLMGVVGEILVAKNSLPYLADSAVEMDGESIKRAIMEKYSFINRLTNQLQDIVMSMRMLPMTYVFDRYPKLVRDMTKKLDKKVKLIQEGGETKLDKNMIEMLADPLVHIVRNSLDHGIEMPEDRIKKGKPESGTVTMRAFPQSDKVIIEIIDDGKGIDGEAVARKVIEKGLIPIEKIEAMSQDEKAELVMLPGLSTAEKISEFSGRGVGMDVVKKSVESFGGTVRIKTVLGKGTTIEMSVPVSLAVTTLLHVMMDGNHYGFPMDSVSETVKLDDSEITYLHNKPFVYIREQIIPLIFQEGMFDKTDIEKQPLSIVVLNIKGNPVAVVVNELLGQLDVVQKPLTGILSEHPILGGTALLGNGQIIMVIDPIGLLEVGDIPKEIPTIEEFQEAKGA